MTDLLVIGGGAAGLMAAGAACARGLTVTVLEHNPKGPGQKLLITGKGRCNVTSDSDVREFLPYVRHNGRFLYSSLYAFPPSAAMELFESLGVPLKTERGRRVFPRSDRAAGSRLVSFHLEMDAKDDVMHSHDVIDRIERDLLVEDGLIATIHFDPVVTGDPHADELKAFLQREVEELAPMANIHDLRIVPGPTHTNVIFDCAVPAEYMTDKQHRGVKLVNALRNAVQAKWPDHFCVIKLEPDYAPVHHE